MDIRFISKGKDRWEIELTSEDHTLTNLVRELVWEHKGEAAYKIEHPLVGRPSLFVTGKNPKKLLEASADQIVKMSEQVEKAFSK
ncbi:MAG: DNA-directed RNA polymerase subunit L [Candidatus Altiarchaeota archaeon]|nr:DNA-directed RNA polymerase subunit L [Candidatus Altiarchaeota archaeon]